MAEGTEPVTAAAAPGELSDEIRAVLTALDEHKGEEMWVLDMRNVASFTDTMVLCTGRSHPHTQALADAVEESLRERGLKPSHIEGHAAANWILMDYLDFIVHVFTPEARQFYQLEKLWRDAPMLEWKPDGAAST